MLSRRLSRRIRKTPFKKRATVDCKNTDHLDLLPGVRKVYLSPFTQLFVGYQVSEDITTDAAWFFVNKTLILDHIELYEAQSEFYEITDDIKKMPKEEILVGTHFYSKEKGLKFYVCVTAEDQQLILDAIEKEKKTLWEKILNSLLPTCRQWQSLGSEPEIDCELGRTIRPLIMVDLEGCMPLRQQSIHFVIRTVEDLKNGYMELVARFAMQSIIRKRVDIGIQSSPLKKNIGVQGTDCAKRGFTTQYSIPLKDVKLTDKMMKQLQIFMSSKLPELKNILKLNFSFNLYSNDYKNLKKTESLLTMKQATEIKSYQDVIHCRRRQISCFTWNAIMSGIVAAAHSSKPIFSIDKGVPTQNIEYDTVFDSHLVLVWHYGNNLLPKLLLHATRDVTALSFCPYNANILVGGYDNGQVAVWDLTGRLNTHEAKKFRTDIQQKNKFLMMREMGWFKLPLSDNHVHPALCCHCDDGHSGAVTSINWIPPSKYVSPHRVFKNSFMDMPHMQFVTASLDGCRVLVWDLQLDQEKWEHRRQSRLKLKPQALLKNVSPLKALKKYFKPVCRLIIKQLSYPVMNVYMQNQNYHYVAENPATLNDIDAMTHFKVSEHLDFDYTRSFFFTTGVGTIHEATWEASDYDPKYFAVNEKCDIENFTYIHDGPIIVCEANPYLPDVVLTIGGSVVAIWYLTRSKVPIFWRKNKERYVTGTWSLVHPLSYVVVRNDANYELWNLHELSNFPVKVFKFKGNRLTGLYKDTRRSHARKKTCVVTDSAGAFKLYTTPSEFTSLDTYVKDSFDILEHRLKIKENLRNLQQSILKKQMENLPKEEIKDEVPVKPVPQKKEENIEKPIILTNKIKWEIKREQNMRKALYKKQNINLEKIEENKKILDDTVVDKSAQASRIALKESQFHRISRKIKENFLKRDKQELSMVQDKADTKEIKERYFNDYKMMEADVMKTIRRNKYVVLAMADNAPEPQESL